MPIGGGTWSGKDFHKPDRAGGLLARRLALQCVHAGVRRRVRVQLEYRHNSAAPESVQVWADGRQVPLPQRVQPVPTRDAAKAMISELAGDGFAPLIDGRLARWGHPGAIESWWEPSGNGIRLPAYATKAGGLT